MRSVGVDQQVVTEGGLASLQLASVRLALKCWIPLLEISYLNSDLSLTGVQTYISQLWRHISELLVRHHFRLLIRYPTENFLHSLVLSLIRFHTDIAMDQSSAVSESR